MRIVIACHAWYGDTIGGSFRLASEFAEYLAGQHHDVHYVCCQPENHTHAASENFGPRLRIHRYPQPVRAMSRWKRLRYHVHSTRYLINRLHAEAPVQALSSHSPLQGLGAGEALKTTGCFINYTVHSPFDDELLSNLSGSPTLMHRAAAWLGRRVDRANVRLADRVQTDSQYTMDIFRRRHGRQILERKGVVAPGWVDTDRFCVPENREALRQRLWPEIAAEERVFFTLRRLEQRMGVETLVEASRILRDRGLAFRCLIGGAGSLQSSLQMQIRQSSLQGVVQLLGRLPEAQLPDVYAAANCFVLPTRALECFGLIVLESFACGVPVIGSETAAIPELVTRQGLSWMFQPGDAVQLADRMQAFLNGTLRPPSDLRSIAQEYSRSRVLTIWEQLLTANQAHQVANQS